MNKIKKQLSLVVIAVIAIVGIGLIPQLIDTVEKGTYQVKQAAITGTMSAKMAPGIWWQGFGSIDAWPKAETFFFTHDNDVIGDVDADTSIEVRFNDGSICNISGTARILLPTTKDAAIHLITERGHKTYGDVQTKLIKPTIRNVLRHTANLMTATESYMTKRGQFISYARDQIANGLYETTTDTREIKDLVSGEMIWKEVTVIKLDPDTNQPIYQFNPLAGTEIGIKNFEVKKFKYEDKVKDQIGKQQTARMAVATAKAKAQEAEQDKLTIEAEGKARVAKAEYAELEKKVVAVVQAQRDKEVAVTHAEKKLNVAKLDRAAAAEKKQENILLGQGEAERKRLVIQADGALQQKLATMETIHGYYAEAYANRKVPGVYMAGGSGGGAGGPDNEFITFMKMMNTNVATQLKQSLEVQQ